MVFRHLCRTHHLCVCASEKESNQRAAAKAERQAEMREMERQALALMTPEEREAMEISHKAEAEEEAERKQIADISATAKFECREAIRRNLHDPRSAEWESMSRWHSNVGDDSVVHVQPQLRAKNAFGALVHSVWDCHVDNEAGTVRIEQR